MLLFKIPYVRITGALVLGYHLIYMPSFAVYKYYYREPLNLSNRYGDKSWVLITGASDGIGKEFAKQFAQQGFNLFLVSRTEDKLKKISEDLTKDHNVEVKYLIKDFAKATNPEFFEDINEQTKELDVSVLVNNVGMASFTKFSEHSKQQICDMIIVNTIPQTILAHEMLPRMLKRKQRSAIINLASVASVQPFTCLPVYSPTKAYNDFFSRGIVEDYKENIDIMSLRPGFVSTNMTLNKRVEYDTITTEECVSGALKSLGHDLVTNAHWKHGIFNYLLDTVPERTYQKYFEGRMKREVAQIMRDAQSKS